MGSDGFPAALPSDSPLAAARLTGVTCDEQDRGAETMPLAIRKQTFVAAVVLVAAGIIAERTAKVAEPPRAPTGSTQLAFAGLTWLGGIGGTKCGGGWYDPYGATE
ncbi:MAG: hypothetical protein NTY19_47650 [Planctomycetota bacterium]|nr:hypothetical protein [Planctomycetota bacterium]